MASGLIHKFCQPVPRGPNMPRPRSRWLIRGKNSKLFSKTTRSRAFIFSMQQCPVALYINSASQPPGFYIDSAPGVISSHRLIMGKTTKIFFSETMRPRAFIFSMYQCLVVLFINSANPAPVVQTGHALGLP